MKKILSLIILSIIVISIPLAIMATTNSMTQLRLKVINSN